MPVLWWNGSEFIETVTTYPITPTLLQRKHFYTYSDVIDNAITKSGIKTEEGSELIGDLVKKWVVCKQ